MSKVSIVIVNYNGLEHNEECINSIINSSYENIEIIIVDNQSTDGSVEMIEKLFAGRVIVIKNEENSGFAGGTNIGISYAMNHECDYVLLLNNDTIIDKYMISCMVESSKKNDGCVISPKIYYYEPNNTIWSAGGEIKWNRGYTIQYGMNEIDNGQYDEGKKVTFATGCCMLIPRRIIQDIGLIAEDYFLYFEDTDYCVKIQDRGYCIYYEPKACMFHKVSATTGGIESETFIYYFSRNRLYFNKKYNKNKFYNIYIYLSWVKMCLNWIVSGKFNLILTLRRAIKDYKSKLKILSNKSI